MEIFPCTHRSPVTSGDRNHHRRLRSRQPFRVIAQHIFDVVAVVLTLTHGYNAVRGHKSGSSNSGAEDYLRRKTNKNRR